MRQTWGVRSLLFGGIISLLLLGSGGASWAHKQEEEWIPLFNGADLTGWIVKIRGLELGEDPWGTFNPRATPSRSGSLS